MKDPYDEYLECGVTPGNLEKKPRTVTVGMSYIGASLSVNHYKYQGRYTKPETKNWMGRLGWLIKTQHIEDWKLPLTVRCDGVFKDKRSQPDLSNLSKIILDALEESSGVNDRDMRWQDGDVSYGDRAELIITITEMR